MANKSEKSACKQVQNKNSKSNYKKKCGCCGIPELWYMSMIQCSACQQWFHEGCVKSLSIPMLLGDSFYIFVCSSCNFREEYVGRLQVTWLELVHLVLFHLMFKYRKSYYDLDVEILPWVKDHWDALQTGLMNNVSDEERRHGFLDALQSNPNRFKCGDETRKRVSWWALRVFCPPAAPKYQLIMSDTVLNHSVVNQILASEPRFIDRTNERLEAVRKVHLNYPLRDEYYEKWMKTRFEYKKRKRKTEVSLPKRMAALDCREKCKIMVQRQSIREMPVKNGRTQSGGSRSSKRSVKQTSPDATKNRRSLKQSGGSRSSKRSVNQTSPDATKNRRSLKQSGGSRSSKRSVNQTSPDATKNRRSLKQSGGSRSSKRSVNQTSPDATKNRKSLRQRSGSRYHQTVEPNVKGVLASGSGLFRQQPSSQITKASQKGKRGKKTTVDNDVVVKKKSRRAHHLRGNAETILWTHNLMAGVKGTTAVEFHGRNCTKSEFTVLMARRIPFYSRTVDDVREYFKGTGNLAAREGCRVMGKRVSPEGLVQYLVVKNELVHSLL